MAQCILYAEDEPDDVFFLEYAFGRAGIGHPLRVLKDGEHVIMYLSNQGPYLDRQLHPSPCLILLDIHLPKKTGFEVLEWIRSQAFLTSIPVVMLTSSDHQVDTEKARRFAVDAYFVKSMKLPELIKFAHTLRERWLSQPPILGNPPGQSSTSPAAR